jgi:hypothetical protein
MLNYRPTVSEVYTSGKTKLNDSIIEELNNYATLKEGWAYGEGKPINSDVIKKAEKVYKIGKYFIPTVNVFPGTNGLILVVFHQEEFSIETAVNEDLTIDLTVEQGLGFEYDIVRRENNISLKKVENILSNFKRSEWNYSESFITNTMTELKKDFEVLHSATPQTMGVSPSSNPSVFKIRSTQTTKQPVTTF